MLTRTNRPARGRVRALLALLVYLGAVAWVPIAHGQTEVFRSAETVESGHSDQCPVIHVEAACALNGLALIQGSTARDLRLADGGAGGIASRPSDLVPTRGELSRAHPARAPPSS